MQEHHVYIQFLQYFYATFIILIINIYKIFNLDLSLPI